MLRHCRTFLVLCTALAAFVASSLQGKVLCFGAGGHAAIEAPHAGAACPAADDADGHGHEGEERKSDQPPCSDVSANLLAVRGGCEAPLDLSHLCLALPAPPAQVLMSGPHAPRPRLGLGTRPPSGGDLACLRGVILLI